MTKVIDYYFSVASPWAYLGLEPFLAMAKQQGATVRPMPTTIIGQHGAIASKDRPPARRYYWQRDLQRWAAYRGKTIAMDKRPPSDPMPAAYMAIAAIIDGLDWSALTLALQSAFWGASADIGNPDVRKAIADAAGLDGAKLLAREGDADVQAQWAANRQSAVDLGVFGSPTYVFGGEPYWGQDSLPFLAAHLEGKTVPSTPYAPPLG